MRTRNPIVILGPDGKPLAGAKVHTTIRSSGLDASVFAAETGATPGENPATTDTKGMIVQWLDRGAFNSTVTAEGMEPYVVPWDSAPGSDASIDPVWLEAKLKDGEPGESTTRKLGHGSKEALPGNEPRVANNGLQDLLQAGVVVSTDWSFNATINSGTAALGSEAATGGVAWLPDPAVSGALLRSVTTPAAIAGLIPSSLPTSGKYRNIGFELTPGEWGTGATVSLKAGTEKSSQAEAEASPAAASGGKVRIRDVVIKNTSGVYSIVAQRDRRPWARGARWSRMMSTGGVIVEKEEKVWSEATARLELTGVPLKVHLSGTAELNTKEAWEEGMSILLAIDGVISNHNDGVFVKPEKRPWLLNVTVQPSEFAAGSKLLEVRFLNTDFGFSKSIPIRNISVQVKSVEYEEDLRPIANNGTS